MGIAVALDVSPEITAGAVVSGASLGDKLSPLSETTVLSAQMVGVDVYDHVKRQAWTSVPAFALAMVGFLIIGAVHGQEGGTIVPESVELTALGDVYHITPLNLFSVVNDKSVSSRVGAITAASPLAHVLVGHRFEQRTFGSTRRVPRRAGPGRLTRNPLRPTLIGNRPVSRSGCSR